MYIIDPFLPKLIHEDVQSMAANLWTLGSPPNPFSSTKWIDFSNHLSFWKTRSFGWTRDVWKTITLSGQSSVNSGNVKKKKFGCVAIVDGNGSLLGWIACNWWPVNACGSGLEILRLWSPIAKTRQCQNALGNPTSENLSGILVSCISSFRVRGAHLLCFEGFWCLE